jgi:hypothetical protein
MGTPINLFVPLVQIAEQVANDHRDRTEWFAPGVKPCYVGLYEVKHFNFVEPFLWWWDGNFWRGLREPSDADSLGVRQDLPWRGLAQEP